jgi:mannose-6-phosphate isomerase-like protein (cupin superfamily)
MEGRSDNSGLETIGGATVIFPAAGGAAEEAARDAPIVLGPEVADGAYQVMVGGVPAGYEGPPLHFHPHTDEAFYVAEGQLTIVFPDEEFVAPAGTLVFIPRRVVHTVRNSGSTPMRGTIIVSPGDVEHLFEPPPASSGRSRSPRSASRRELRPSQ